MSGPLRVVVVGAGPIGLAIARGVRAQPHFALAAVVDVAPAKTGQDAGVVSGEAPWGLRITPVLTDAADVAIVCTSSSLAAVRDTLLLCLARGMHVVSTCEELVWPWWRDPAMAQAIDDAAVQAGRGVVGTGVNPGFLMDALPVFLSAIAARIDHVHVVRAQDASLRRRPFQEKVGVGLDVPTFRARAAAGGFLHRGLEESAAFIAAALGVTPETATVRASHAPVVADVDVERGGARVPRGTVLGVEQDCVVVDDGGAERVCLRFEAVFGHPRPRDEIVLRGAPPLHVRVDGVHGDVATAAIVVHAARVIGRARPGLRTMLDLPLPAGRFARGA